MGSASSTDNGVQDTICTQLKEPAKFTCAEKYSSTTRLCWCSCPSGECPSPGIGAGQSDCQQTCLTPVKTPTTGAKPKNAKYYAKKAVKYWRRFFAKRVKQTGKARPVLHCQDATAVFLLH